MRAFDQRVGNTPHRKPAFYLDVAVNRGREDGEAAASGRSGSPAMKLSPSPSPNLIAHLRHAGFHAAYDLVILSTLLTTRPNARDPSGLRAYGHRRGRHVSASPGPRPIRRQGGRAGEVRPNGDKSDRLAMESKPRNAESHPDSFPTPWAVSQPRKPYPCNACDNPQIAA